MEIALTTVGERGQAVIPKFIRDKMPAPRGTMFSVVLIDKDTIVMKRLDKRKMLEEFKGIRASITRKFSDQEIVGELKRTRKA